MSCLTRKLRGETSGLNSTGSDACVISTKISADDGDRERCRSWQYRAGRTSCAIPAQIRNGTASVENLHRSQLSRSNSFALRLRIPGSLLISYEIQAGLKPCSARPSPVILWQARLVVVPLIDRTLAEDCFPSVHSMLLSGCLRLPLRCTGKRIFQGVCHGQLQNSKRLSL